MSLEEFDLGTVLRETPDQLAAVLRPVARAQGFTQRESEGEAQWYDSRGALAVLT